MTDKKRSTFRRAEAITLKPAADMEMYRYIGIMMNFFGVPSFDGLIVEYNAEPNKAQQIKEDAIARAKEAGKSF